MKLNRAALVLPLVAMLALLPILLRTPLVNAQSTVASLRSDIKVRRVLDTGITTRSVRIAKDTRYNALYYLKQNGDIYRVDTARATSSLVYTASQHTVTSAQGFAIGPTGSFYIVGNENRPNLQTRATIVKGVFNAAGQRSWSVLARSADYPRSNTAFDHRFNGIVVSPAGDAIYVNSGSRTDHGEVQSAGGLYPNTREVGLTACILRLPTSGQNLFLANDRAALRSAGYLFAEGIRNSFDMAFAANGDLLATENGPDRDMSEELNWLRSGRHYGFPWRIGGADNPQQYPDYDPSSDRLLDARFTAVKNGYFRNDPAFPPRPATTLIEPIVNAGPDADSYRDPRDGQIKDASTLNQTLSSFTSHRSPLGLVFDVAGAMSPEFNGAGFMLSWTKGDSNGDDVAGPFNDPSEDLVHLALTKPTATTYRIRTSRLVGGFRSPIDAEVIGNKIYVLEYGGNGGLWEITMPPGSNMVQNGSFESTGSGWVSPWTIRNDLGAVFSQDATTRVQGSYAAKVHIPRTSTSAWLVQLRQKNKALTAGERYTIDFWAKASAARTLDVSLNQATSPYTQYFLKRINLTTSWQHYLLSYTATTTNPNVSLNFNFAHTSGQVWLDNISLRHVELP